MNASVWDVEAQDYLTTVVERSKTVNGYGGVPCAWPTTIFETSWVGQTSTFLSGYLV